MKNYVDLSFCIGEYNDITHQELTELLGLEPIKVYVKGEPKHPHHPATWSSNRWYYKPALEEFASFDEQMEAIYDVLTARKEVLKPICERYYCELSCEVFIYADSEESTPWIHLGTKYNDLVKELNIEFDVDIMFFAAAEG